MLSRSCKVEQASKTSLGNWEDKACEEAEPEELPEASRIILRTTERGSLTGTRLFAASRKAFFLCFKPGCKRNTASSVEWFEK